MDQDTAGELLREAAAGREQAWTELVEGLQGLLRAVARSYRLDEHAVDDAVQTAWLRLFERTGTLRRPERVAAWLVTTVRRECLLQLREAGRSRPLDVAGSDGDDRVLGRVGAAEDEVVRSDEARTVRAAVQRLSDRQRRLVTLLVDAPELDYRQVGRTLAMPVGSIGPTRGRALQQLRQLLEPAV